MQLLVSVRSGAEVEPALLGGADIIDAKEPDRGSLGSVSSGALADIVARVPHHQPLSVALGDVATTEALRATLAALELPSRAGPTFIKLGFAQVASSESVGAILTAAVTGMSAPPSRLLVVAVAYADAGRAASLPPEVICRLAHTSGAAGVLMDTWVKDGAGLLQWWSPSALGGWIATARAMGLLTALAGSLRPDDVQRLSPAAPDILGFRGAACDAGRTGEVSAGRVALLRHEIDRVASGSMGTYAYPAPGNRETRHRTADPATGTDAKSREFND
jgi:uncharacterized protein (UPF0264 family)